ncbi:16S rRNA (cytidine(1402)-2'-O)-methyltransferase [Patescibacteria group bacterium]
MSNKTTLYVVGTPIGNLDDVSFRAVEIFKTVDFVICEDTRITKRLMDRYEIHTPLMSYHQHSKIAKLDMIISRFRNGESAALVSDAGTPGIADPGGLLVAEARSKLPDIDIITIPGPSALTAAASISGINMNKFLFLGFLPHKKGRETLLKKIAAAEFPVIVYESPHRLQKFLHSLAEYLSDKRIVIVAKELTKINEAVISDTADHVEKYFLDHPDKVKGEFVIIVGVE